MYIRKNNRRIDIRKRNRKTALAVVISFMIVLTGVYAFVEMNALAAPEEVSVQFQEKVIHEEVQDQETPGKEMVETIVEEEEKQESPLIVVDAGHGGEDTGCIGFGIYEKDINLQIAMRLKSRLEERGFRVMMPRETDELISKEERVELANSYQADAYVSIHQNTYEGSDMSVNGIEIWYDGSDESRDSERLARLVHQETINSTGANERVVWDISELYVTNRTLMPACLIETGFLTNKEECQKLSSAEYQEKIAEGIAQGIELYFYADTRL